MDEFVDRIYEKGGSEKERERTRRRRRGGGWRDWQRRDERAGCKALKLPRFIVGTDWSVPRSIRGSFH